MKSQLLLFVKGIAVGIANIIPGVSGGTMAVVLGIYERLIGALGSLVSGRDGRMRQLAFLGVLAVGAVVGIKGFGEVLKWAMENHRAATMMFFMGLILGSIPPVLKMGGIRKFRAAEMAMIALGLLAVLALGDPSRKEEAKAGVSAQVEAAAMQEGMPPELVNPDYGVLAVCGFAAGAAMITPGVSGSLLLLLLGQYYVVIIALHSISGGGLVALAKGIIESGPLPEEAHAPLAAIKLICVVGISAVAGVIVFARLIEIALKRAPSLTHAAIVGLVGGSVVALNPGMPRTVGSALLACLCLVAGTLLSHMVAASGREEAPAEKQAD